MNIPDLVKCPVCDHFSREVCEICHGTGVIPYHKLVSIPHGIGTDYGWKQITGFVHKGCGSPALRHPYINNMWGCERHDLWTLNVSIYFGHADQNLACPECVMLGMACSTVPKRQQRRYDRSECPPASDRKLLALSPREMNRSRRKRLWMHINDCVACSEELASAREAAGIPYGVSGGQPAREAADIIRDTGA